jgi:hypothetical protein
MPGLETSGLKQIAQATAAEISFLGLLGASAFYKVVTLSKRVRKLEQEMAERRTNVEISR